MWSMTAASAQMAMLSTTRTTTAPPRELLVLVRLRADDLHMICCSS